MKQTRARKEGASAQFGSCQSGVPPYQGLKAESYHVLMSDGVGLAANVTLTKNLPAGTRIPALLVQTRYSFFQEG
jgi:hypothetical protein